MSLVLQVERVLKEELTTGIKDKYKLDDQEGLRQAWDSVQRKVYSKLYFSEFVQGAVQQVQHLCQCCFKKCKKFVSKGGVGSEAHTLLFTMCIGDVAFEGLLTGYIQLSTLKKTVRTVNL